MPEPAVRVEPSQKWVRGFVNGQAVVDSKRVKVAYGLQRRPVYCFPRADVRSDRLRPSSGNHWSLDVDGRSIDDVAWSLDEPPELRDHLAFEWKKLDAWFEEDDEVFAHPRDPYHRVDVLNSSRHI